MFGFGLQREVRQKVIRASSPHELFAKIEELLGDGVFVYTDSITLLEGEAQGVAIHPRIAPQFQAAVQTLQRQTGRPLEECQAGIVEAFQSQGLGSYLKQSTRNADLCAVIVALPPDYECRIFNRRYPNVTVARYLTPTVLGTIKNNDDLKSLAHPESLASKLTDFIQLWPQIESRFSYETKCLIVNVIRNALGGETSVLAKLVNENFTTPVQDEPVNAAAHSSNGRAHKRGLTNGKKQKIRRRTTQRS